MITGEHLARASTLPPTSTRMSLASTMISGGCGCEECSNEESKVKVRFIEESTSGCIQFMPCGGHCGNSRGGQGGLLMWVGQHPAMAKKTSRWWQHQLAKRA